MSGRFEEALREVCAGLATQVAADADTDLTPDYVGFNGERS